MALPKKDMIITRQHKSCMPALVITLYCKPFGIVSASDNAIHLDHAKPVLHTYSVYTPTMILLINTGKITKKQFLLESSVRYCEHQYRKTLYRHTCVLFIYIKCFICPLEEHSTRLYSTLYFQQPFMARLLKSTMSNPHFQHHRKGTMTCSKRWCTGLFRAIWRMTDSHLQEKSIPLTGNITFV